MAKSADEQIRELQERRDQLNARIQSIKAKENAKARKARTHRLIQVGALLENALKSEFDTEEKREALSAVLNDKADRINALVEERLNPPTPAPEQRQVFSSWTRDVPPSYAPERGFDTPEHKEFFGG